MSDNSETRVLVTGATGYIAANLVQQLLQKGYLVRGTVRSLKNPQKIDPIKKLDKDGQRLELVEADLSSEDYWESAVEGCNYVYHTASPFPLGEPKDENEVIKPAVDGTLNVLKACAGKVKRVVLTSSVVSIGECDTPDRKNRKLTEKDWLDDKRPGTSAYYKSKKLAEKAAWDYLASLDEDKKFELAVVNPGMVMGPPLTTAGGASIDMLTRFLTGQDPAVPKVFLSFVDVRDVARAHIAAMTTPEAAGNRHILIAGGCWILDMTKTLKEEFGPHGYNPPTRNLPYFVATALSWFDPAIKAVKDSWGIVTQYDNTRMREVLKVEPVPWQQSIIDMGYALIENGKIPKKKKYKGRNGAVTPAKK